MFKYFSIDQQLADSVDKELHDPKVDWGFYGGTLSNYEKVQFYPSFEILNKKYGPIIDTIRFTDVIYNSNIIPESFYYIRTNPNSRYNIKYPNTAKLIDTIQFKKEIIPNNYKVDRIYINLFTIRPNWQLNYPHFDSFCNTDISVLYYVNNSDGDTYFFEKDACIYKTSPIKGTGVVFPSCIIHAGAVPIKNETRICINIKFKIKK